MAKESHREVKKENETGDGLSLHSAGRAGVTNLTRRLLTKTGMLPLDFLTAVYRDELWTHYTREVAPDGKTYYFIPSSKAKRIHATLDQRIHAAGVAMPYVHKKLPQGIEVSSRAEREILAEQLRQLSPKEMAVLASIFERLDAQGAPESLKGAVLIGARTYEQLPDNGLKEINLDE